MAKRNASTWNNVTPFSKYLAMFLFILLPFVGFYVGIQYQKSISIVTEQDLIQKVSPNKLIITRPEDKMDSLAALTQTITDERKVKELYDQIDMLPNLNKNFIQHCPVAFYSEYSLSFYRDDEQILHALVKPTGCLTITMNDSITKDGINDQGEAFIDNLQQSMGLSNGDFYGYQNGRPLR